MDVLYTLSATLGEGIGLVFSPANVISAGVGVLLSAAKDVEASQDDPIDLFERIENFFKRLEAYRDEAESSEKIPEETYWKKEIEDALKRLDKLTQEVSRMAAAEILKLSHIVDDKYRQCEMFVIDSSVSGRDVSYVLVGNQIRRQITISPAVSNTEERLSGTLVAECMGTGDALALLWIYGKRMFPSAVPDLLLMIIRILNGSGKSILCSAIIQDIQTLRKAGLASIAYFYFDVRDLDKQNRRNLLPSLLVQLSTQSGPRCDILHHLYLEHEKGSQVPSEAALIQCLKDMPIIPNQPPIYIILDATSVQTHVASRRIVKSRPEFDIRATLGPLALHAVSLHDESGQKRDIVDYIHSVVYSDSETMMKKWREGDKKMVVEALSEKADGSDGIVRRTLNELPESLDETYERVMIDIKRANHVHAYHMLQCLTAAIQPLSVAELAELLAFDFDAAEGGIPQLNSDWRWEVMSKHLITVVPNEESPVVQFSHFSVKEFLMSNRLATSTGDISQYHISLEDAHTVLAQASLGVLLRDPDVKNG
ncbi:hypothetical protein EDB89DRAFT_2132382 [Lactarius sanguifluus]|nr:hypothetical protein EDB89DRAFT_2132382 [Lactarius sanguifluus]